MLGRFFHRIFRDNGGNEQPLVCKQVQSRLLVYLRKDLPGSQQQAVGQHLSACPDCSRALEELRSLEARLFTEAAQALRRPSLEARRRMRQQVNQTLRKGISMKRVRNTARGVTNLAALTLVIILVFAGVAYVQKSILSGGPAPAPEIATEATEGRGDLQGNESAATLTFGILKEEQARFQPLVDEFNRQNPDIFVQIVLLGESVVMDEHLLASAADTFVKPGWIGSDASSSTGGQAALRDLQPLIEADVSFDAGDFWPDLLAGCQDAQGRTLGLPLAASIWGVFYDAPAFDEAGLPRPQPGWTLSDFRLAASQLVRQDGDAVRYGFADGLYLSNSILMPVVEAQMAGNDGEINPQALGETIQWYFDLARSETIFPVSANDEFAQEFERWQALFFNSDRRPAMWVGPLSGPLPGKDSLFSPGEPFAHLALQEYGFAPFPILNDGSPDGNPPGGTLVYPLCVSMSAGTAQIRPAWSWLSFLTHHRLAVDPTLADQLLQPPARRSIAQESGYWQSLPDGLEESIQYILEHAWTSKTDPQTIARLHSALTAALNGRADLLASLAEVQASLDNLPQPTYESKPIVVATPQPTPEAAGSSIRFFPLAYAPGETQAMAALAKAFNEANPGRLVTLVDNYQLPQDGDFVRALSTQTDCFTWYRPDWEFESDTGNLMDISPYFYAEPASFTQDFYAGQLEAYRFQGSLYGIPAVSQPEVMYYNADLLAQRGLQPPTPNWTFSEFYDLVLAATSNAPGDQSYGFVLDEWSDLFFKGRGLRWASMEDYTLPQAFFNGEEMRAYLAWLNEEVDSGVLYIQTDMNWSTVRSAALAGRIAFWPAMAGDPFSYADEQRIPTFSLGVVPMPDVPGLDESLGVSWDRGYFISPQATDPRLCWDWISFLSGQPDALQGVPARRSVAESAAWITKVGPEQGEMFKLALEGYRPGVYNTLGSPYYTWRHDAVVAARRGEDLDQTLAALQQKADAYVGCISATDTSALSIPEKQELAMRCAKQVDPQGNWP
jgi:ABC-type glycerol-3-phosphate transport system substrate-binding protein